MVRTLTKTNAANTSGGKSALTGGCLAWRAILPPESPAVQPEAAPTSTPARRAGAESDALPTLDCTVA